MLGKIDFWIVLFYILLSKISSQTSSPVFPSWVFSGVFIPKNIGFFIDVIVVLFFWVFIFHCNICEETHLWLSVTKKNYILGNSRLGFKEIYMVSELFWANLRESSSYWIDQGQIYWRHKPRVSDLVFDRYTSLWSYNWESRIDSRGAKTFLHGRRGYHGDPRC